MLIAYYARKFRVWCLKESLVDSCPQHEFVLLVSTWLAKLKSSSTKTLQSPPVLYLMNRRCSSAYQEGSSLEPDSVQYWVQHPLVLLAMKHPSKHKGRKEKLQFPEKENRRFAWHWRHANEVFYLTRNRMWALRPDKKKATLANYDWRRHHKTESKRETSHHIFTSSHAICLVSCIAFVNHWRLNDALLITASVALGNP